VGGVGVRLADGGAQRPRAGVQGLVTVNVLGTCRCSSASSTGRNDRGARRADRAGFEPRNQLCKAYNMTIFPLFVQPVKGRH
jgi:hypothetical protein